MITLIGNDINYAARILSEGGLVAIPTETVYGLAGNALDENSVTKIFEAKNRPSFDPLIVHTKCLESIKDYLDLPVPQLALTMAHLFWPGPMSIILNKKRNGFSDLITAGHSTVAVRVPNHSLTLELLNKIDFPIVAPSANPFGYVSPTTAQHVYDQLSGRVDYILDGGPTKIGLESTIIDFTQKTPLVRRKGGVTLEDLLEIIPKLEIADFSSSNPSAPGMLKSHYSTSTPIYFLNDQHLWKDIPNSHIGGLFFNEANSNIPSENQLILSPNKNLSEAAQNLFAYLRILDQKNLKAIIVEPVPNEGLGKAINDKLLRASSRES